LSNSIPSIEHLISPKPRFLDVPILFRLITAKYNIAFSFLVKGFISYSSPSNLRPGFKTLNVLSEPFFAIPLSSSIEVCCLIVV